MADRLTSRMLTSALVRRAANEGGFAVVMRKGDEVAGSILLICLEKGQETGLFERIPDFAGGYRLAPCGPKKDDGPGGVAQYIERRVKSDPDIWVIELDIPEAERFAAEIIC